MSAARSAAVLTGVNLFAQAVGFVYRIFLSRQIGSEVMGLYQLVLPVSSVFLSLTAVGFTVACSNLSAQYRALKNQKAASQAVRQCVRGFLTAFAVVAGIVLVFSDAISVHLLGDARSQLGILLLLPCVLLTGLENIHKHYFYGSGLVQAPAAVEICEQLVRTGAVLGLLAHFLPQSPERSVGLIVCGMIICEICSAAALIFLYRREMGKGIGKGMGKVPAGEGIASKTLMGRILQIAVPIGLTSLLGNLMGAATSVLIPHRLVRAGADVSEAMSAFGVLCGMTLPMLTLPTVFLSAMGLVLVPRLAKSTALGQTDSARRQIHRALSTASLLVLPGCSLLAVIGPSIGRILFQEPTVGEFSIPLAVGVALTSYEAVLGSALNGLGKQTSAAQNSLICGAIQLAVTWIRMGIPGVGLQGYVEGVVISAVCGVWLNWRTLQRAVPIRLDVFHWIVAPGLAALLAGLCSNLLLPILRASCIPELPACLGSLGFGLLIYVCALSAQGAATTSDRDGLSGK